jgi:LysM repeat protein
MLNRIFLISLLAISIMLFSCSVNRQVVTSRGSEPTATDYINSYKDLAIREMKRTGVPASITLAQGMIESDLGRSRLAREANNHFGIKCHSDWKGATIRHNDDRRNECFRKYQKPEESFYDHSDFLKSESRYNFLFDLDPTEYKAWARGLKKAGYATNPDYANMLIKKIEENNLWHYDQGFRATSLPQQTIVVPEDTLPVQSMETKTKPASSVSNSVSVPARVPRVLENNRIRYLIVKDGDTKEKLEKEFQLLNWELTRYNELAKDFELVPGQILYLQPKREKAEPGKDFYICAEGDTMYLISQRFGVKLRNLYEMNRMEEGSQPEVGRKLWLRTIKPVD